jgi:putative ABC transport system permease protein
MNLQPPKYPLRFLRWFCREDYLDEIEGDLIELFEKRAEESPTKAKRRFVWDVVKSFRPVNFKTLKINNWAMSTLRNYTIVYFRRFRKEATHYLVNTLGLALGFMVFFFVLMYVYDERTIDTYHSKSDRIYRVLCKRTDPGGEVQHLSVTSNMLSEGLKNDFPAIEETARMINLGSSGFTYNNTQFNDRNYAMASSGIFKILDFKILAGDPLRQFSGPMALALNQTTAKKLFGDEDPIGKVIDAWAENVEVIAVYEDIPGYSTYQFNAVYVTKFDQFKQIDEEFHDWMNSYESRGMTTWVLLKENASPESIMAEKTKFMEKYFKKESQPMQDFYFQPISDIHLDSGHLSYWGDEVPQTIPYSNRQFVAIALLVGLFVIVIAGLNYINLSSVQALKRTLEAGIRKVNGASVGQLRMQLFLETFITLMLSYGISVLLVLLLYQQFVDIAGKNVPIERFLRAELLVYHLAIFLIIWLLSSLIPALYYSRLNRSVVLKKNAFSGKGDMLRKSFVVVQYGISLCLIIGSIVLYRQLSFVQTKDLGFKNEHLLTLDINSSDARDHFESIVHDLLENSNVVNASASSRVPGEWKTIPVVDISLSQNENPLGASHYAADNRWLDTYGITLAAGQNFSGQAASDTLKVILNETAVRMMGLEDPVGQSIWVKEDTISKMQVIGVVKDFHIESLHKQVGPVVITSWNNPVRGIDYFTIKFNENASEVISHIEAVQGKYDPETPAEINFLDERWERYYRADQTRSSLILIATVISILISAFGLFGLVNFTAERKTKEIGIRKVLGATTLNIIRIVLKDYVVLFLVAFVLAAPLAWWVLNAWLSDFAYRINMSVGVFAFAFTVVLLVSFTTVISRVYRLAKSNPIDSVRYE